MHGTIAPAYSLMPRREILVNSGNKNVPGPGNYMINTELFNLPKKHAFPKAARSDLRNASPAPGPGSYKLPSTIGEGPKPVLIGKVKQEIPQNTPGPGQYNPKRRDSLKSYSFGVKTENKIRSDSPGPGKYEILNRHEGASGVV